MEPNINTPKRLLLPFLGILLRSFRLKKHPVNLGGLLIRALESTGAYRTSKKERDLIESQLWVDGKLNRNLLARDADVVAVGIGLGEG